MVEEGLTGGFQISRTLVERVENHQNQSTVDGF